MCWNICQVSAKPADRRFRKETFNKGESNFTYYFWLAIWKGLNRSVYLVKSVEFFVGLIFVLVEEDWVELVVGGQLFEGVAFAGS